MGDGFGRGFKPRAVAQGNRAQPLLPPRQNPPVALRPLAGGLFGDPVGEGGADLALGDGRGQPDLRFARITVKVGGDEVGLAGERISSVEDCALAAREEIARLVAGAALADTVGVGQRHHLGEVHRGPFGQARLKPFGLGLHPLFGRMADHPRPIVATGERFDPQAEVGGSTREQIALA